MVIFGAPELFRNRCAILVVTSSNLELWFRSPVLNHFYQLTRGNRPQEDQFRGIHVHSLPWGLAPSGTFLSVTGILARFPEAKTSPYTRARKSQRTREGHEALLTSMSSLHLTSRHFSRCPRLDTSTGSLRSPEPVCFCLLVMMCPLIGKWLDGLSNFFKLFKY